MMFQYVAIDSEYCSMGRWISVIVGYHKNMKLYEGKDLVALADEVWLTEEYLNAFDERLPYLTLEELRASEEMKRVHTALSKAILKAVSLGPCIIHERAAGYILKDRKDCLKVLLYNTSMEHKLPRAISDKTYQLETASRDELLAFMEKEDHKRSHYRDAITSMKWGEKTSYDLCLDSDVLSRETCAEVIMKALSDVSLDPVQCANIIEESFI